MDKVIIKYHNNGSVRYDGIEYLELISNLQRYKSAKGSLKIGESVTVKTKSRLWKAVVVNLNPNAHSSLTQRKRQAAESFASRQRQKKTNKSATSVKDPDVSIVLV